MSDAERVMLIGCAVYVVIDGIVKGLTAWAHWVDGR